MGRVDVSSVEDSVDVKRNERIRIARVIARMNVGGPALIVTNLMQELDSEVFDQQLFIGSVGKDEDDYLALHEITVPHVVIPGLGRSVRLGDDIRAFWHLCKGIRAFRPDIVETHTAKAGVLGRVAARMVLGRKVRLVHVFHGHLLTGYFRPVVKNVVVLVERILAQFTDRLISVGAIVRDDLLAANVGRREQYVVVPPAVEVEKIPGDRRRARESLGLSASSKVVAFVGRLTEIKRPDRLIDMSLRVAPRISNFQLLVAGDGTLLKETVERAQPLGSQVKFLGFRSDVYEILAASDVVVLTSDNEGMPVSLIEAAACGRAAVTTNVGSAGEVVLDNVTGKVVDCDVDAVAQAVEQILSDPLLQDQYEKAAFEHAKLAFSKERLSADMSRIYGQLMKDDEES